MASLSKGNYRNEFVENFPGDLSGKKQPRQTPGVLYSLVNPTAVEKPQLIAWSDPLARDLGIESPNEDDIQILGGNQVAEGMKPYAACYAGHQFGNWAGQLGDGRAITLSEWISADQKTYELQLKGAGQTPYSRSADGRAVLRSSVREYLMSEAMYHLGVPTTRALALVSTGDQVMRDMFYNGNPQFEPGAIVMRVAPSFLRFGNFEILAARGEIENLRKLVEWTISRYYPHLGGNDLAGDDLAGDKLTGNNETRDDKILKWFGEVVEKTAAMIVEWMRVGFVHGVMNTDNMSILGLTIDYGPYSFMDDYDPNFTPNTTDLPGRRYAFGKQPSVAKWNLACLANALAPLLEGTEELVKVLDSYDDIFWAEYFGMMSGKLGLDYHPDHLPIVKVLEQVLNSLKPDMTIFFQLLKDLPENIGSSMDAKEFFAECFYHQTSDEQDNKLFEFIQLYSMQSGKVSKEKMQQYNPVFILRNYLLHQAIEALEKGDQILFDELHDAIRNPYSDQYKKFLTKRPGWAAQKPGSSMLSCSS
ncbi:MAG: protein adenylyltransferase SelO [Flavitalea sp.]